MKLLIVDNCKELHHLSIVMTSVCYELPTHLIPYKQKSQ